MEHAGHDTIHNQQKIDHDILIPEAPGEHGEIWAGPYGTLESDGTCVDANH